MITKAMGDVAGVFSFGSWTAPNGVVDVNDLTGIVDAFSDTLGAPNVYAADTLSCVTDQTVTVLDFVGVVDGFRGFSYEKASLCPTPCP